ncbi:hypothetical protein [Streptomyces sp. AN091965]|uniref:hypothetical protein n=1 Tax=Streptomyces sp. AN091965 TaxID=2927803 RepID=UPI001F6190CF|nr:hypothetical protein [Streptomyces sp. AN091965]MCI3934701.1 hypothetical protein [Streptomyces sp. AN091965]
MNNFTGSSGRAGAAALAASAAFALVIGVSGPAHAERLPFPGRGYASVGGPVAPGGLVDLTVKERPGNPRPTAVEVSSPALNDGTAMGDTGAAWVGAGRVKKGVRPGTYAVTFTLRHKDADCVGEGEEDYTCDYPAIVLRKKVTVAASEGDRDGDDRDGDDGAGFGRGVAVGAGSAVVAGGLLGAAVAWRRRRRA